MKKDLSQTHNLIKLSNSYFTIQSKSGVFIPTIAANIDVSMKYIQENYFHYRVDETIEILGRCREIKSADNKSDVN